MVQPPTPDPDQQSPDVYVSVDVASVGALWTRDSELTWEALNQLDGLLETMVDDMGGRLVDTNNDAFIIQFKSAAPAVMWCARMQEGLLALDWPATLSANFDSTGAPDMMFGGLLARMAIHAGSKDTLRALVTLTQPGQVLMSRSTWSAVVDPVPSDLQITELGFAQVHGQRLDVNQVTTRLLSRRRFGDLPPRTSALPCVDGCFIDRPTAMSDLRERIESGSRLVNITGPTGVGKTRLARQWATRFEGTGQGEVALVQLGQANDETDLHLATGLALGLSLNKEKRGSLDERVGHAISSRGPLVMILDDFPSSLDPAPLATWLHSAPQTKLILTSIKPIDSSQATHLQLGMMEPEEATALFLARSHRKLRGLNRPTHASAIPLPDPLKGMSPHDIESTVEYPQLEARTPDPTVMQNRHVALDKNQTPNSRIAAALACVPDLKKLGMGDVALTLFKTVDPIVRASGNASQKSTWTDSWADLLIASGQLDQAEQLLEESADQSIGWTLKKSKIAIANGQFSDAAELLSEAPTDDPVIAFTLGQALAGSGDWEEALPHLEVACHHLPPGPDLSQAWATLGRVLSDLGQIERSSHALDEAIRLNPKDPHLYAKVHLHRFEAATASLELDVAQEHLNKATSTLLKCGDRSGAAYGLMQSGIIALIRHDPTNAMDVLRQAHAICRDDGLQLQEARTLLSIGITARMQGDLGTALDAFAEAAALAEPDACLCALIHAHRGATEAACDAIDNAVDAFEKSEALLESGWDATANTIHDVLMGFVDLARARDAALDDRQSDVNEHVDLALNRLARASSFETRSTPPRGRETPSRINELRLARLLLDYALSSLPS